MNVQTNTGTLNNFLYDGYGSGLFTHVNTHTVVAHSKNKFSVGPAQNIGMIAVDGLTYDEYLRIISEERYSAIFFDYSLVCLEWEVTDGRISRHRYMYIPCPLSKKILEEMPPDFGIADYLLQANRDAVINNFISQGYIRFDYTTDVVSSEIHHPLAHFTTISANCRLALKAPLSTSEFFNFLFENFYPEKLNSWTPFERYLRMKCEDTIRPLEKGRMHLSWV